MINLKISHKVIIGFLIIFLLFSSNFFILIFNNYKNNKNITNINNIKIKYNVELINIQKNIIKITEVYKDMAHSYNQEKENEILALYSTVNDSIKFIETSYIEEGKINDAGQIHDFIEKFKNFYNLGYEMVVSYSAGNNIKAASILINFDKQANDLLSFLQNECEKRRIELTDAFEKLKKKSNMLNRIAYLILIISIFVIIITVIIIIRSITKNVSLLITVTNNIEKGDLTQNVDLKTKDEIGVLSHYFNSFINNIRNIINNIKSSSVENIDIKNNMISQTEQIDKSLSEITSNLNLIQDKVKILNQNIQTSSTAIDQIARNIESLDNQIENQSGAVTETSASISEMIASINNVAKITNKKKEAAAVLIQKTNQGYEKINLTNSLIENITSSVDDILEMINIINQIASQTDLLSMNANIEASHAGEAGKGFAVVADEIRNLAESAGENSNNIAEILNKVVKSIKDTSNSSRETKKTFEDVNNEIKEVVQALDEIASTSEELSLGGEQILSAMFVLTETSVKVKEGSTEMKNGSNEIITSMNNVNTINLELVKEVKDISLSINQIKDIINENLKLIVNLNNITEKLNSQINNFKS